MDRGAWQSTVHGVAKSPPQLSHTFTFGLRLVRWLLKGKGLKTHKLCYTCCLGDGSISDDFKLLNTHGGTAPEMQEGL